MSDPLPFMHPKAAESIGLKPGEYRLPIDLFLASKEAEAEPEDEPRRPCGRGIEECDGLACEETDGVVRYWVCEREDCGFEFDYEVIAVEGQDTCQLGVPETVRRAASGPMEEAVRPKTIPLTVMRRDP